MLAVATLGDARADFVTYVGPFIGRERAQAIIDGVFAEIRSHAAAGVAASPEVAKRVADAAETRVKPWVIGAVATGAAGVLLSIIALVRTRRK